MAVGNLLIDTSIIIDHLRKKNKKNSQLYHIVGIYTLFISTITVFELYKIMGPGILFSFLYKKKDIEQVI
jgi:rRNA-processing protein FCF1